MLDGGLHGGQTKLELCPPNEKGAIETTLDDLHANGKAGMVRPPKVCKQDFEKVLLRSRATVSSKDLEAYTQFTAEFGGDS